MRHALPDDLCDHAQSTLGADEQCRKVEAGVVLGKAGHASQDSSVWEDNLHPTYAISGRAVAQRTDSARVARDDPADGGAVARPKIHARVEPHGSGVHLE